jgi:hypothetical protein
MTPNAAHNTQGNFRLQTLQTKRTTDQVGNGACLLCRIDMIEFENHRIALSAVDARMRAQKIDGIGAVAHDCSPV